MARPLKHGLDYFPLDCNFDDKVRALVGKFKARGLGIFTRLLQTIYSSGYYIETTAEMIEDMGIELNVDEEIIKSVIDFACRRKIFCSTLYKKHKVLTSHGIQKRFLEATRKRKDFNKITIYGVNDGNNPVNVGNNPINDSSSTQRKGKEIKGKERKEPPTLEEFEKYCQSELSEYALDAKNIYYGYKENDWHDTHGNEVKNWKMKLRQVWCKNKTKPKVYQGGYTDDDLNLIASEIVTR